jgi:hypothetical protein
MAGEQRTDPIEATYRDESEAAEALRSLQDSGLRAEATRRELDDPVATHAYETKEGDDVAVGMAMPPMTKYQLRSAAGGVIAGALALGGLGAIAAAILVATNTVGWAVFAAIIAGAAVAGATIGAILGGSIGGLEQMGREERFHREAVVVRVFPRTPDEARRARDLLEARQPEEYRRGA